MEILNEGLQGILYYHLILFSAFTINPDSKFAFGNSFIAMIGLIMAFNIGYAIFCSIRDIRRKKRLEVLKKAQALMVAEALKAAPRLSAAERKAERIAAREAYLRTKGFAGGLAKSKDLRGPSENKSDAEQEYDEENAPSRLATGAEVPETEDKKGRKKLEKKLKQTMERV